MRNFSLRRITLLAKTLNFEREAMFACIGLPYRKDDKGNEDGTQMSLVALGLDICKAII